MAYIINISTNAATTLNLQQGRVKLEPLDYCEIHTADLEFAREHYNSKELNLYIAETDKELELILSSKKVDTSEETEEDVQSDSGETIEIPTVRTVNDIVDLDQVTTEEILNSDDVPAELKAMIQAQIASASGEIEEMIELAEAVDEMEESEESEGESDEESTETEETSTEEDSIETTEDSSEDEGKEAEEEIEESEETEETEESEEISLECASCYENGKTPSSEDCENCENDEGRKKKEEYVEGIKKQVAEFIESNDIDSLRALAKNIGINIGPNIGIEKLASKIHVFIGA